MADGRKDLPEGRSPHEPADLESDPEEEEDEDEDEDMGRLDASSIASPLHSQANMEEDQDDEDDEGEGDTSMTGGTPHQRRTERRAPERPRPMTADPRSGGDESVRPLGVDTTRPYTAHSQDRVGGGFGGRPESPISEGPAPFSPTDEEIPRIR